MQEQRAAKARAMRNRRISGSSFRHFKRILSRFGRGLLQQKRIHVFQTENLPGFERCTITTDNLYKTIPMPPMPPMPFIEDPSSLEA